MNLIKSSISKPSVRSPVPLPVVETLKSAISARQPLLRKESVLVLVCGAGSDGARKSCRDYFLEYGSRHLQYIKFFKAEEVFEELREIESRDLLSFEGDISKFTDCILLFLESPGSIAEVGAFAMENELAKTLLIVTDIKHKNDESFINLGPIAKANKVSVFKPAIYVQFAQVLKYSGSIADRLNAKLEKKKRKRINLNSYEAYISSSQKHRMLFLADLIALFSPVSYYELASVLKTLYETDKNFVLKDDIGILKVLKLVEQKDKLLYRSVEDSEYFYDFRIDLDSLRAHVVGYYFKNFKKKNETLLLRSA